MTADRSKATGEGTEGSGCGRPNFPIVAIAASAGGIEALSAVLRELSADLPAAVIVLQHLDPHFRSMLPDILRRSTSLDVVAAAEGCELHRGQVVVCPPGLHCVIGSDRRMHLVDTVAVNFVRPSADVLFQSLAEHVGPGAVAVVLTGTGHDGAVGASAVSGAGGIVLAQDEATSSYFGMPGAAIASGGVHEVLPLSEIGPALVRLVSEANDRIAASDTLEESP